MRGPGEAWGLDREGQTGGCENPSCTCMSRSFIHCLSNTGGLADRYMVLQCSMRSSASRRPSQDAIQELLKGAQCGAFHTVAQYGAFHHLNPTQCHTYLRPPHRPLPSHHFLDSTWPGGISGSKQHVEDRKAREAVGRVWSTSCNKPYEDEA